MNLATLALLVLGPLLVWRVYSRVRKAMARQQSIMARHWTGALVFAAMILLMLTEVTSDRLLLTCWAAGTAFGIGWGVYGARRMRLQVTPEGYFFTPYAPLGIVFAMLFAARVMYILFDLYASQGSGTPVPRFSQSPLTVLSLTLMAGYFATIAATLVRWRLRQDD